MKDNSRLDEEVYSMVCRLEAYAKGSSKTRLKLPNAEPVGASNFFAAAQCEGELYRKGCGMASRKKISVEHRRNIRRHLFRSRYILDSRIENTLLDLIRSGALPVRRLLTRNVFGFCKKQGVSFRLSLSTCKPSPLCGGGCYAHDGRERVTSTILSGCYNTVLVRLWEEGRLADDALLPHISRAVELAKADAVFASKEYGVFRRPRVRLAHVGELAAFPSFANWLGQKICDVGQNEVDAVVYTRHPNVKDLDTRVLVVNLTIDASSERRRQWKKDGVRLVWSAWDGQLDSESEINFLEHHDNGVHFEPVGEGQICPVTHSSSELRFCDAFGCTHCFDKVGQSENALPGALKAGADGSRVKTRVVSLLNATGKERS